MARQQVPGTIYIGKFEQPIGNPEKRGGTAQLYIGWTEGDPEARWEAHMSGQGANITGYVASQGLRIEFRVLETGVTRERERELKSKGHYERHWQRAERQQAPGRVMEPKQTAAARARARRAEQATAGGGY